MSQPPTGPTTAPVGSSSSPKDIEKRINSQFFDLSFDELRENNFFLTTFDNSFDPFEEFDNWFVFDRQNNYNSLNLLARIANVSDNLGEAQSKLAIVQAMHDIVRLNLSGKHRIVVKPVSESTR